MTFYMLMVDVNSLVAAGTNVIGMIAINQLLIPSAFKKKKVMKK